MIHLEVIQSVSYAILDYQYFGLYQYLINNWDGDEVVAIQITLIPDGNLKITYHIEQCHLLSSLM